MATNPANPPTPPTANSSDGAGERPKRPIPPGLGNQKGQKAGPFKIDEIVYMRKHANKVDYRKIAQALRRNPRTVKKWLEKNVHDPKPEPFTQEDREKAQKSAIKVELRNSLTWKKLKEEFFEDELLYFEEEYIGLINQFKDDVYKAEESQIRKAITMDILMRRNLAARHKLLEDIDQLEGLRKRAYRDYNEEKGELSKDDREKRESRLLEIERQLADLRNAEQSKTREYSDLDSRHQKLMEALKATREQRISRVESSKQSVMGLLRELENEEKRNEAERVLALVKRATERESERLAGPHVYDDGNEDHPILSHETLTAFDRLTNPPSPSTQGEEKNDLSCERSEVEPSADGPLVSD